MTDWRRAQIGLGVERCPDDKPNRAERDRRRFHPENPADYGSTVGIPDEDGNLYCVGCYWCCPE